MGKVRLLPADLANQIAAGEVVERPASVVKELVENALDAHATRVRVDIEQGGLARIRVNDDGEGMSPEDARLALERHATSKIARIEDLARIGTFGFRGEALPSIASVSRLSLVTRARTLAEAVELTVEGGIEPVARPTGAAPGTTIDVRDLFFNVPARRKFLKSQGTEAAHVGEAVVLAALARPDVTFVLARDGRVARELLRVETRGGRVQQVFEGERLERCVGERGPMRFEAFLSAPERARAGAVALHLFVNGRPVKDRPLARAVAQAYGSVLEPGRYPVGVLYIELPPELVDVNVHPQKAEVRFADARSLYDAVTRELHVGLARAYAVPVLGPLFRRTTVDGVGFQKGRPDALRPDTSEPWRFERAEKPESGGAGDPWGLASEPPPVPYAETGPGAGDGADVAAAALFEPGAASSAALSASTGAPEAQGELLPRPGFYGALRFLAQVRNTFLLCEGDDGLYILDQHAAAERVTFARLRRAFASRAVAMQKLLVAEVVELSAAELALVEERSADIAALGVELSPVGTSAVAVHGVPKILSRVRPTRIVRDVVAELGRFAKRPFGDAADLVLATMACHGSVRAGDAMAPEEARALLVALDEVDFAGHCPHGRPIVTRLRYDELERRVGR